MNLLLLLSALLSALTGAVSTVRAPTAAHAMAGTTATRGTVVRTARAPAARPAEAVVDARGIAMAVIVQSIATVVPLYTSRRRE